MKPEAYVLTSTVLGTFLGVIHDEFGRDLGVWTHSKFPAFVPMMAVCFASVPDAMNFADRFDPPPQGLNVVKVRPDVEWEGGRLFASREACVAAGCKTWIGVDEPTVNELPI